MNSTIEYYNQNAEEYIKSTIDVDFSNNQDLFIKLLPKGGRILDFGCGSGRDSIYFADRGFDVTAVDGSEKECKLAREIVGQKAIVKQMLFSELSDDCVYDGIWACASILHLSEDELISVMKKMSKAVKPGGIIYTSFKYGTFEGTRGQRYFIDFDESKFSAFLELIPDLSIERQWVSSDVRPGRGDEKWLNIILKK